MKSKKLFDQLWQQYASENPSAERIHQLFSSHGERVINDHVAFRTFDDSRVNVDVLARPFLALGYREMGTYHFETKKLRAKHFELPGNPEAPRVFISELMLGECSGELRAVVKSLLDQVEQSRFQDPSLILSGALVQAPSFALYSKLREESEYAAWLYAFGFRANHFTVSINYLQTFKGIREVNQFLKDQGFPLNASGGEVKGSPEQLLEQSSTLADHVDLKFQEGVHRIPSCYYEFAMRYPDQKGNLFSGFIAGSADKIFESTDFR